MNSKFQPCINIANRVKEISSYTGRSYVVVFNGKVDLEEWSRAIDFIKQIYGYLIVFKI